MSFRVLNISLFLLQFVLSIIACSKRSQEPWGYESFELTAHTISRLTSQLKDEPAGLLVAEFRDYLPTSSAHQELCLKYLVGSVVLFKQADSEALNVIRGLCGADSIVHLADLVDELSKNNSLDTIAQFIAAKMGEGSCATRLETLISEMVTRYPSVMEPLIVRTLAVLKSDNASPRKCYYLLRCLPVGRQYEMLCDGSVSLDRIGTVYSVRHFDSLSREIFFLARCSHNPNSKIREEFAKKSSYFMQFMPNKISEIAASPCSSVCADSQHYLWGVVFGFLDVETLILILPSVCKSWRKAYSEILKHSVAVHTLYLQDLGHIQPKNIHTIAPWRYCFRDEEQASRYFGHFIVNGDLGMIKLTKNLTHELKTHIQTWTNSKHPFPRAKSGISPYYYFLKLRDISHEFLALEMMTLNKPDYFTRDEYERAVYYFVYEKRLILKLDRSLVVDDMPRLFGIIKEDEELMEKLIVENFGDFARASIVLLAHRQATCVPGRLARLVFSQAALFKGLVEQGFVPLTSYYEFIVERGLFPKIAKSYCWSPHFPRLMLSLILSFKSDPGKIDRIMVPIAAQFSDPDARWLVDAKQFLIDEPFMLLRTANRHQSNDAEFVRETMVKYKVC